MTLLLISIGFLLVNAGFALVYEAFGELPNQTYDFVIVGGKRFHLCKSLALKSVRCKEERREMFWRTDLRRIRMPESSFLRQQART